MDNKYEGEKPAPNDDKENKRDQSTVNSGENPPIDPIWGDIEKDPTKIKLEKNLGELATGTFDFIKSTLSLRHGKYDYRKVITETKENVVFSGYNVWILICSIVVASVGLNMDSVAVVIGAMLISPLMGPIRGIGVGVGMNDFPLLISSLKNFGIMVAISLVTSILYFLISPIDIETTELLGRKEATFLDPMIAFFGGLAGIIAFANGKNDTVINGVAIATALMPPLCTAGYGIANGDWGYFVGASYLFLLNSLFIALSAIVLLRYLKFPKRQYVSNKVEKKVQVYIIIFLIAVITPSAYLFYEMTKKSNFEENVNEFVQEIVKPHDQNMIVTTKPIFDFKESVIELSVVNAYIDSTTLGQWNRSKVNYDLEFAAIKIIQGKDLVAMTEEKINEALGLSGNQNELINLLREKDNQIQLMQTEFDKIKFKQEKSKDPLDLNYILKGFKEEFTEINKIAINRSFSYAKNNQLDTTYIITLNFKQGIAIKEQKKVKSRINKRFCFELREKTNMKIDSVSVINF